jgi:hypothetical protein
MIVAWEKTISLTSLTSGRSRKTLICIQTAKVKIPPIQRVRMLMPIRFQICLFLLEDHLDQSDGYLEGVVAIFLYEKREREDCIAKK